MSNPNVELSKSMYDAFQRGDVPYILDHVADDVTWGFNPLANVPVYGLRRGKNGVAAFFQDLNKHLEFHTFEPRRFVADGNDVVVYLSIRTTVKSSGIDVDQDQEIHVFRFENGKVRSARFYHDCAKTLAAFQVQVPAAR